MTTRARDGLPEVRRVGPDERARLARTLGAKIKRERVGRTVEDVAAAAGLHPVTLKRLEAGIRRPTTSSAWKLAKALRPHGSERDVVALYVQLCRAAGESLQVARTKPHRRRDALVAELLAEAGPGPVVGDHYDSVGSTVADLLALALTARGPGPHASAPPG